MRQKLSAFLSLLLAMLLCTISVTALDLDAFQTLWDANPEKTAASVWRIDAPSNPYAAEDCQVLASEGDGAPIRNIAHQRRVRQRDCVILQQPAHRHCRRHAVHPADCPVSLDCAHDQVGIRKSIATRAPPCR